jgi:hypothetical protein
LLKKRSAGIVSLRQTPDQENLALERLPLQDAFFEKYS